jgi:tetratricopeptide (TPR) repeat protein
MKNSNELFLLIKTLSKNEKGYFKKFASINSKKVDGNYLRLFDCIDAMEEYDEKYIRKEFEGEKFLSQLNVTKLYLQKMIIRALRNYHSDSDTDIERLNLLIEAQMLIKKQLYDSAHRVLKNLIEKSKEVEASLTYLYGLQLDYQILIRKGEYTEMQSTARKKLEIESEQLEKYQNLCDYRYLQAQALSITQIEGYTRNESRKQMQELLNNPLLKDSSKPKSFMASLHRNEILLKCYLKTGDGEMAYQTAKEMLKLFDDNPSKKKITPYNYFVTLNSVGNRCISTFRYEEAKKYIAVGESLLVNESIKLSDSQRFEIAIQMAEKKMIACGGTREFEEGIECEKRITALIKNKPVRAEFEVTMKYFSAVCYFGLQRYEEALDRINFIIHEKRAVIRKDLQLSAYILNVIIHHELGNKTLTKRLVTMSLNFALANKFPKEDSTRFFKILQNMLTATEAKANTARKKLEEQLSSFDFVDTDIFNWWLYKK